MRKGKAIAVLGAVLDNDAGRAEDLMAALAALGDAPLVPVRLRGLVLDGREDLAFWALVASGAVHVAPAPPGYGVILPEGLAWLAEHLAVYFEAIADTPRPAAVPEVELAWTLPAALSDLADPPPQSLAALMRSICARARDRLYLHSPFLEPHGVQLLVPPAAGAAGRGAAVILISHGLDEPGSPGEAALRVFRDAIPTLHAYTAPKAEPGPDYLLLHAKLVIADGRHAVMASANITRYALQTHLEVGIGLEGPVAAKLEALLARVITSNLVRPIE